MPGSAFRAIAFLVGTIVGAGVFALPDAGARSGIPVMAVWFVVLTAVMLALHLMYGEIILRTPERHRLPGYARLYLGKWGWRWGMTSAVVGGIGTLLVYLVLLGLFLSDIFSRQGDSATTLTVVVAWSVLGGAVALGVRTVAKVELVMTFFLLLVMGGIAAVALPRIELGSLFAVGPMRDAIWPYGVLLFALSGTVAIPEIRELFSFDRQWFRRSIILGTLLPAVAYFFFTASIFGALGSAVTEDLFVTLAPFGSGVQYMLAAFGILAVTTSFLAIGSYLVDTLQYDFGAHRRASLAILAVPLFLFLLGARDLLTLISVTGTFVGFTDGLLLLFLWLVSRKHGATEPWYALKIPEAVAYGIMIVLLFGAIAALVTVV